MDQVTWLFLGGIGIVLGAGILALGDQLWDIVLGFAGAIAWALWSYGATNVEIYGDAGEVATKSYEMLAFFGIVMVALYLAVGYLGVDGVMRRVVRIIDRGESYSSGGR